MKQTFDEISLKYWKDNCIQTKAKSYTCIHNGYVYGDDMDYRDFSFVHADGENEIVISGETPKKVYIKTVEAICNYSSISFDNFRNQVAKKYKVFSEEEVSALTQSERNSNRIYNESSAIQIDGTKYYVSSNLKICEYFYALCNNLVDSDLENWFIRITFGETVYHKKTQSSDELEEFDRIRTSYFEISIAEADNTTSPEKTAQGKTSIPRDVVDKHIDYLSSYKKKKELGELGEVLIIEYEKNRLMSAGRHDLAESVEHSSKIQGDGLGYDICSFSEDGTELLIEVKSTKQSFPDNFQMSRNEIDVANKCYEDQRQYRIYRLYDINTRLGRAKLRIFEPPFTEENYCMIADSYTITI